MGWEWGLSGQAHSNRASGKSPDLDDDDDESNLTNRFKFQLCGPSLDLHTPPSRSLIPDLGSRMASSTSRFVLGHREPYNGIGVPGPCPYQRQQPKVTRTGNIN